MNEMPELFNNEESDKEEKNENNVESPLTES